MTSVQETAAPAGLCSGPQSPCHRSQRCWGCSALTAATALKLSGLWAVLSTQLQLVEDPQGPRAWNHQSLANGAGGEPGKQVAGNTEMGEEGLRIWVLQGEDRVSSQSRHRGGLQSALGFGGRPSSAAHRRICPQPSAFTKLRDSGDTHWGAEPRPTH